jgi:putative SbcD/Mre11-related phosphoesterase
MKFIHNAPAILHKGALIIGDTHFGIENRLRDRGINMNDFSVKLAEQIVDLIKKHKAKKLIFLGDVKDDVTYLDEYTYRAFRKIKEGTEKIRNFEIIIVRGNHDGGIEELGFRVEPSEGFVFEKLGLTHGHSWPSEECMNTDFLLSSHQHPQWEFVDSSGKRHVEPVWVIADIDEKNVGKKYEKFNQHNKLVLLPAFNPIVGNPLKKQNEKHVGPLLNNKLYKWNHAIIYRLNGVAVGRLSDILR